MWPIGAYTVYSQGPNALNKRRVGQPSRWAAAMVLAAGSVSNLFVSILVLSLVWIGGYPINGPDALAEPIAGMALLLSGLSILMGVFNLLPAPPLDGWLLVRLAFGYESNLQTSEKTVSQ